MKKLISVLLILVMTLGIFAGCADQTNTNSGTKTNNNKENVEITPLSILANTLALYTAEDVKFNVSLDMGIDMEENAESLSWLVYVPEDQLENVTAAATMIHSMNVNSFTGAAIQLKEEVDAEAFATTLKDAILGTQWMCGFPEKLIVATVGENFVVVVFGLDNDEAPLLTTFQTHLEEAYHDTTILFTEDIGG